MDVHVTDYDKPLKPFCNVTFHQADVRELPIPDNTFDKVLAVSTVEHIGLQNPEVLSDVLPPYDSDGDLRAVCELVRVLKKGGDLIMTLPFGVCDGLISGGTARCYTIWSIRKFEKIAQPVLLHYYEYQYRRYTNIYTEYSLNRSFACELLKRLLAKRRKAVSKQNAGHLPDHPGRVTWRRVPMEDSRATHYKHIDGIVCGVWRKL